MRRAFVFAVAAAGLVATFGAQACNGLALDDRPCPCAAGWVCCVEQNVCMPDGTSCGAPGTVDSGASDSDVPSTETGPGVGAFPRAPVTLARAPRAFSLACSTYVIYAGTTDGNILEVPLRDPKPRVLTPAPPGVVGYITWADDDYLFYTVPAEGLVMLRQVAGGYETVLAHTEEHPSGIAATRNDVFFATERGIARVSPFTNDQTPSRKVVFSETGHPQPRGAARGMALSGPRFVVAHAPTDGDQLSGSLATYASTGESLSHYTFFSATIGVATSELRTYWSQTDGVIRFGPKFISSNGLAPTEVVVNQVLLGDVCFQDGRLYFTAAGDDDVREIRYVDVER